MHVAHLRNRQPVEPTRQPEDGEDESANTKTVELVQRDPGETECEKWRRDCSRETKKFAPCPRLSILRCNRGRRSMVRELDHEHAGNQTQADYREDTEAEKMPDEQSGRAPFREPPVPASTRDRKSTRLNSSHVSESRMP